MLAPQAESAVYAWKRDLSNLCNLRCSPPIRFGPMDHGWQLLLRGKAKFSYPWRAHTKFLNASGARLSTQGIANIISQFRKDAGIEDILRHLCCDTRWQLYCSATASTFEWSRSSWAMLISLRHNDARMSQESISFRWVRTPSFVAA